MDFEWDEAKNRSNVSKHGVRFEDACKIFDGFTLDALDTRFDYGETRTVSVGIFDQVAVLVVVHTDRSGVCRIISARQANKKERELYDAKIRKSIDS